MILSRSIARYCLFLIGWASASVALAGEEAPAPFGFDAIIDQARDLANRPHSPPPPVPKVLSDLSYDAYRDIRYRFDKSLWRQAGDRFDVHFIHPGLFYTHSVQINLVEQGRVTPFSYSKDLFDFGRNTFADQLPPDLGYAGLVLNYPLKQPDLQSQVIVFAGASYFRALGRDNVWGLSARGLAVDTGHPNGEEFPYFRAFWLEKPAPDAKQMTVYALLDSHRVTGAYRFVITPGKTTVQDVTAHLFLREGVGELGIAPLTSMYMHGENQPRPVGEWRPEVHDSDGLLMANGDGERIWRPLANMQRLRMSGFSLENPRGFGLLQRDRHFHSYEDLETRQELRPSLWVVPKGDWGKGRVKLTEIPSESEANDNIVAYWVPDQWIAEGRPLVFEYGLRWGFEDPAGQDGGRITATRIATGDREGVARVRDATRFLIDFQGEQLAALGADQAPAGVVSVGAGGELVDQQIIKNDVTGGWRLVFKVRPPKDQPLELRAFLKKDNETLSETWSYLHEL